MLIGVPKEIKTHEYRVGATPAGVRQLIAAGHEVVVESNAGVGSGFSDEAYTKVGAKILPTGGDVWTKADMIIKVKEPLPTEFQYFRKDLILYTYLHLAAFPELTKALLDSGVRSVAYETITDDRGALPLLRPMSEVAGRMATQVGAASLEKAKGGKGVLLGGVPGTNRAHVTVLGGGVVGTAAARIAIGMGARVTMLDVSADRMSELEDIFGTSVETLYSNQDNLESELRKTDLLIGAVLVPGAAAPKLVKREHLSMMEKGTVVVDVAVDQGGCIETCKPTTHDDPIFEVDGVVHYCVANMPGAVPRTSTLALTGATLPYAVALANHGVAGAARANVHVARGVNTYDGACVCEPVAQAHGLDYTPLDKVL